MLKKRLLSALTAVCMGVTMLSSIAVNAAEKTLAPWSVYFTPQHEHEDFTKWGDAPIQYDNGYLYVSQTEGNPNQNLCLSTKPSGYTYLRTASDTDGTGEYGAPAIGFTAPKDGNYTIDFYAICVSNHPGWNIANAGLGTLDNETSKINVFDIVPMYSNTNAEEPGKYTQYTRTVDLKAGELLLAKFYSTEDAWNRMFNISYKVTDAATGTTYDFNDIGRKIVVPEINSEKTSWDISEYNQSNDNLVWSLYLASDIGSSTWNDMTAWKNCALEDYRNASNNGIYISNNTTQLSIYDSRPDGWFFWRPGGDGESNGQGTVVIGWTAPEAGTYAFDVEAFNYGTDVKSGEATNHRMAYKKADEETPTLLDNFNVPGAAHNTVGRFTAQYKVEAGETIYLLNDAGSDGWGDSVDMKYKITNVNDPSKSWSASNMYKHELTNSPFRLWYSKHGETNISNYFAANLLYQGDNKCVISSKDTAWVNPYIKINNNGTFNVVPDGDGTIGGDVSISFDVPSDGFYKVDFTADNLEPGGGAGAVAYLYGVSGRTASVTGDPVAKTNAIRTGNQSDAISQILSASKGDKLILKISAVVDAFQTNLLSTYKITKLEKFNYSYKQGTTAVSSVSELTQGETLTATLNYLDDKAQALTLVTAVYNAAGTMTAVGVSDPVTSTAGEPTAVSASLTVPEMTAGSRVQTFIVDGLNTLVPLDLPNSL